MGPDLLMGSLREATVKGPWVWVVVAWVREVAAGWGSLGEDK